MDYIIMTDEASGLYHHGILGQKWGVRRYQNEDGTLTEAGKKHKGSSSPSSKEEKNTKIAKIATAVTATTAVAAFAYVAYKNKDAVASFVKDNAGTAISSLKNTANGKAAAMKALKSDISNPMNTLNEERKLERQQSLANVKDNAYTKAKGLKSTVANTFINGTAEGVEKGVKAVGVGLGMLAVKDIANATLGKNTAGQAFQANNNKKIGSFWKYQEDDNKNRDDD